VIVSKTPAWRDGNAAIIITRFRVDGYLEIRLRSNEGRFDRRQPLFQPSGVHSGGDFRRSTASRISLRIRKPSQRRNDVASAL